MCEEEDCSGRRDCAEGADRDDRAEVWSLLLHVTTLRSHG